MDATSGNMNMVKGAYYYGTVPVNAMGALSASSTSIVTIAGGAGAVGFDVFGFGTFISNGFDALDYTVKDTGGNVLASGSFAADYNVGGYIGVVSDTDLIGSVEFGGTSFGSMQTAEFAGNIQVWNVPAPGALAVLGLGGAFMSRRRR